ncbi:MAG: 6-phosphofructokinase [Firmicutes bacterium]|nr:6-phosphofructokinase [Bacillota bacterium]
MRRKGNGVVAQSGGPTAVINNSLCGVIQGWLNNNFEGMLLGAVHGIRGVLEEDFIDLSRQKRETIKGLRFTPGSALGSCRYKLKEEDYRKLLNVFQKNDIRFFFYIGGNDSMDTANRVHQLAMEENYEMTVVGIPKTIDNDLPCTDHCPGYGSAAKFLAATVLETGIDLKGVLNNNRIKLLEVMGRNAGWLAASTALAKRAEEDAPHLIYLPEVPFSKEQFLLDVQKTYNKLGYAYIVVSEGIVDKSGRYIVSSSSRDSFGHRELGGLAGVLKELIENEVGIKVRCNVLGTAQRSAMHFASRTDADEAYMAGEEAVRLAARGESGFMVTFIRDEGLEYNCSTGKVELDRVANVEKKVPVEWINADHNFVNEKFIRYARPLIQGEVVVPTRDGLPDYRELEKLTDTLYAAKS